MQPQGDVLAVAAMDPPVVRLFDLESGRLLNELSHGEPTSGRAGLPPRSSRDGMAPDGERLAAACDDHKIYVWDWLAGRADERLDRPHTGRSPRWRSATRETSWPATVMTRPSGSGTIDAGRLLLTIPRPVGRLQPGRSDFHRSGPGNSPGALPPRHARRVPAASKAISHGAPSPRIVMHVRMHPRGRLLATAAESVVASGSGTWSLSREIAHLSAADTDGILFEKDGTGLLTYDSSQLRRWPLELSSQRGTPARAHRPSATAPDDRDRAASGRMAFCGPDQKRLAIGDFRGHGVNLIDLAPRPRVVQSWRTHGVLSSRPARMAGGWRPGASKGPAFKSGTPGGTRGAVSGTRGTPTSPSARMVAGSWRHRRSFLHRGGVCSSGRWGPGNAARASPWSGRRPRRIWRSATMAACSSWHGR